MIIRELNEYEQYLQSPDIDNRFNFCVVLEYSNKLFTHQHYRSALDALQNKHSILQQGITSQNQVNYFYKLPKRKIPFHKIILKNKTQLKYIIHQEIHTPFNHHVGPLLRVTQVKQAQSNSWVILITFDHLIADAIAATNFTKELLQALIEQSNTNIYSQDQPFKPCDKQLKKPIHKTGLLFKELSQKETSILLTKAKKHKTTVQSILLASGLKSLRNEIKQKGAIMMLHESAINLRRFTTEISSKPQLSCLFGISRGRIEVSQDSDTWELSTHIKSHLISSINKENFLNTINSFKNAFNKIKHYPSNKNRLSHLNPLDGINSESTLDKHTPFRCCVSNIGIVDFSAIPIKIDSFSIYLAIHGSFDTNSCFHVIASTVNNKLSLTFSYPSLLLVKSQAKSIFQHMIHELTDSLM